MKLLNKIIIIILILLVIGLYFKTDFTKNAIKATGKAISDIGKKAVDEVKETETAENITKTIKEKIPFKEDDKK